MFDTITGPLIYLSRGKNQAQLADSEKKKVIANLLNSWR